MTNADELHLMSGAYVLNALDDDERVEYEQYLLNQPEEVRTEVAEMSETAVLLGLSSRPATPSPALKANVMAMIASTPQLAPLDSTLDSTASPTIPSLDQQRTIHRIAAGGASAGTSAPSLLAAGRAETKAQARWYSRPLTAVLAAAAAIAIIAGSIGVGLGIGSRDGFGEAQAQSLAQLTAADDLQTSTVSAVTGGGDAKLLWSDSLQRSAMLIDGLPALESDQTYQLWYIDESGATSAGTLSAADDGSTTWRVLDGELADGDVVGMTVEPEGGSSAPTTDPIVVINA